MAHTSSEKISMTHLLVPMTVMAFTLALFFAYQLTQVMRDRDSLHQTIGRQDTPFMESQKLNAQFGGLVMGTKKLAEEGNVSAQELVKRLKQIGILPSDQASTTTAPVPAAMEKNAPGPVKP